MTWSAGPNASAHVRISSGRCKSAQRHGGESPQALLKKREIASSLSMRKAAVKRNTKETAVEVAVDLGAAGRACIATGIGFLDHMLDLLARHSRIDITVKAEGVFFFNDTATTE